MRMYAQTSNAETLYACDLKPVQPAENDNNTDNVQNSPNWASEYRGSSLLGGRPLLVYGKKIRTVIGWKMNKVLGKGGLLRVRKVIWSSWKGNLITYHVRLTCQYQFFEFLEDFLNAIQDGKLHTAKEIKKKAAKIGNGLLLTWQN